MAVLADIHGNLPALEAVLGESDVTAADAVVLLGDIALGPMPGETLDVLAGLGQRAVWVHGNCEREMVAAFDGTQVPGPNGQRAAASAALMSWRHRDVLDGLPLTVTVEIDGLGPALCSAGRRHCRGSMPVSRPWSAGTPTCSLTGLPPGAGWSTQAVSACLRSAGGALALLGPGA